MTLVLGVAIAGLGDRECAAAQSADLPTVSWVTRPPAVVAAGSRFTVSWRTSASPRSARIVWDVQSPPRAWSSTAVDPRVFQATLTAPASGGVWYYQVRATFPWSVFFQGTVGASSPVAAMTVVAPEPPPNDDYPGTLLSGSDATSVGNTLGATWDRDDPATEGYATVWWHWTAPATGTATVSTAGSSFDTILRVYEGRPSFSTRVSHQDYSIPDPNDRPATFRARAELTYSILVTGVNGEGGEVRLKLTFQPWTGNPDKSDSCGLIGIEFVLWWAAWTAGGLGNLARNQAGRNRSQAAAPRIASCRTTISQ